MNILERHQRAAKKANIYYHRFLTKYKNEKRIYVFCEGNEDFGYYVQAISKAYPDLMLGKIFVEGKDNVFALQKFFHNCLIPFRRVLLPVQFTFGQFNSVKMEIMM